MILSAALLTSALLSGCFGNDPEPDPDAGAGTVTSVAVTTSPATAASGSDFEVCFRAEGTGRVPHVAVHTDSASHPASASFADYKGAAYYPAGRTSADPAGYALPGTFCVTAKAPASGTVYYRAHAMASAPGVVSDEKETSVEAAAPAKATGVTITQAPATVEPGASFEVCWKAEGTGTAAHLAVHWDSASHPGNAAFSDYKGGAVYPDNANALDPAGYALGQEYCADLTAPQGGAIYYRGHVLDAAAAPTPGLVSAEKETRLGIAPQGATFTHVVLQPWHAAPEASALVCWRVEGDGKAPHVALHTDTTSHPGADAKFSDYKGAAYYPGNATALDPAGYDLPARFCTNVKMPASGNLYLRSHVIEPTGAPAPGVVNPREVKIEGLGPATSVSVTTTATSATAGSATRVCWKVEGTGTVAHTALHSDSLSHPSSTAFSDYKGAAYYPDNRNGADPQGYELPGTFCANVAMPATGTVYYRAHVIDAAGAPGKLTDEKTLAAVPGAGATRTFVTSAPAYGAAGAPVQVCWRTEGTGTAPHVALHTDSTSRPYAAGFSDYKGTAYYPKNASALDSVGYVLPFHTCSAVTLPASGTLYLRSHVIDAGGAPGRVSDVETAIAVIGTASAPTVLAAPKSATGNSNVVVCWSADGAGVVPHTALHTDTESHASATSFTAYAGSAYYPGNTDGAVDEGYALGDSWCASVRVPGTGALYFRAHVIDAGGAPGKMSDEWVLRVA